MLIGPLLLAGLKLWPLCTIICLSLMLSASGLPMVFSWYSSRCGESVLWWLSRFQLSAWMVDLLVGFVCPCVRQLLISLVWVCHLLNCCCTGCDPFAGPAVSEGPLLVGALDGVALRVVPPVSPVEAYLVPSLAGKGSSKGRGGDTGRGKK